MAMHDSIAAAVAGKKYGKEPAGDEPEAEDNPEEEASEVTCPSCGERLKLTNA